MAKPRSSKPPSKPPAPAIPQPRPRLDAGAVVADRYRILEVLGAGSMGTVYAVEHLLLKKKLAVKVLHPELTSVKSLAIRFEREAKATARIDHPNVAAAVDFGRLPDGAMFLALEFVEGRSLRSEIAKGPFELKRALHVAKQLASVLAVTQPLGIVHRDLKPENVMLVQRGDDPDFVKVLDFGIARIVDPADADAGAAQALTKLGAVFGTPEYMAPEQALGQRVDPRADFFSLGVMLFEMIAGVRPFDSSGGQTGILAQQITSPRLRFADVAKGVQVPEAVERVVNRLLAKGVAERYQRASDLVQLLDDLMRGGDAISAGGSLAPVPRVGALPAFDLITHAPDVPNSAGNAGDQAPQTGVAPASPNAAPASPREKAVRAVAFASASLTALGRSIRSAAALLQERFVRRFGARLSKIPPFAWLTFGVGLTFGLIVAVVVWIVAASRHDAADEAAKLAAASRIAALSATSASAPSSVASTGSSSKPEGTVDAANDPDALLAAIQTKLGEGRDLEAVGLVAKVLSKHPDRRSDPRVVEVLYQLANSNAKDASDTAFALLEGTMATKGADIMYQLWLDKAVRDTTRRRAERWLRSEPFARSASNATVVATRLRLAETCQKKYDQLALAAKGGAAFALAYLREIDGDRSCGLDGKSDCYPCLRKDNRLKDAIAQIESRVSK